MRIFAIALILIGTVGVAKQLGFISMAMVPPVGPLLLVALGAALLLRRPRACRQDWQARPGGGGVNTAPAPSAASPSDQA